MFARISSCTRLPGLISTMRPGAINIYSPAARANEFGVVIHGDCCHLCHYIAFKWPQVMSKLYFVITVCSVMQFRSPEHKFKLKLRTLSKSLMANSFKF